MFNPKSVALIGASNRDKAVGQVAMRNLVNGGFNGPIMPVNPKEKSIHGVVAYPNIQSLPIVPDVAVICIPPAGVIQAVKELIAKGCRAAICLTAGLELIKNEKGQTAQDEVTEIAKAAGFRILGPNCVGLLVPPIGLNASFAHRNALNGRIAFVSQSGAMCTAIIDWACSNGIGFSHFISIGNATETDTGDVIEYLGNDQNTTAIMLYMESIVDSPKFLSVVRKVSKIKPIVAVKSGASDFGAKAAASHTGALAGADNVYEAALARAGILRVKTSDELFEAASMLSNVGEKAAKPQGERLAILTNGGGAGVLAVDALAAHGGKLADLSPETIAKLNENLPNTWSHGNPVDIIGDAPVDRYNKAFEVLLNAPEIDNILVMHCPIAVVNATDVAQGIVDIIKKTGTTKSISACWLGAEMVRAAWRIFNENNIPQYDTPEKSVRGYMHLVKFHRNQQLLAREDAAGGAVVHADQAKARSIIKASIDRGVMMLNENDAKLVLKAYGVPVAETRVVANPDEAATAAKDIGFPVVLKILSDDISHKSDAGGVILNLNSAEEVKEAAVKMNAHIGKNMPQARLQGFTVQNMIKKPNAQELIVGVNTDRVFGKVILFGQGGVAVEVVKDSAVQLAPLNMGYAKDLISRTRVSKLLAGYRDKLPADVGKIATTLCGISQLVTDIPEIQELDINPLLADDEGVVALDARIKVKA
jgi:acetyltransferase